MEQRSFFHSFPRSRDESVQQATEKGLQILSFVMDIGLVLAPETVTWRLPQVDGTDREIEVESCRICFTELSEPELPKHGERFGAFALEFSIDTLRRLGALPVIYMPQAVGEDKGFSSIGSSLIAMIDHARHTLDQLEALRRRDDADWMQATYGRPVLGDERLLTLSNTDEFGNPVAINSVPMKQVRDLLAFVGFQNAPFWMTRNSLEFMQNLFYPTDDAHNDELLAYYRQREWRLAPGPTVAGAVLGRDLTDAEKALVMQAAPDFWSREIKRDGATVRRIDAAKVVDQVGGRPVCEQIGSVIVPAAALDEATRIVAGRVQVRVLNPA